MIKKRKLIEQKNGIFGYRTICSVMYTCLAKKEAQEEPIISTDPDQSFISEDLGNIENVINFTPLSESESKKDESESLLRDSFGDRDDWEKMLISEI